MESSKAHRFRKSDRLLSAAAFGHVFNNAKRSGDKWFTVLSRRNGRECGRLGLAIAKKRCKKAVARNRLKRVVRESFRQHKAGLKGLDIVVMNKTAAGGASNEDLFISLEQHWRRCRKANTPERRSDRSNSQDNGRNGTAR